MKYPFIGYAPDADPTQPGIIVDCMMLVPSLRGMKGAPSAADSTMAALDSACTGAASVMKLDGSTRTFAGAATKLYEAGSGTWSDRTRVAGGDYASSATVRWRFAQYGNVTIASNKSDLLQYSSSAAFANIGAGVPKAAIVEVAGLFVFAFDTNEATYSDSPDRWWCCALGDYTDWTPSIATQCATGRLLSSPGKIRGAKKFGNGIVAYKENSMFLGTYVGPPAIWEFNEIPGKIGALSHESIVNIGTADNPRHIFIGPDDFYSFDGSRPVPIGSNKVKQTVFTELLWSRREQCVSLHDSTNSLVYFWYPSIDSANPDKCVVYNYRTDKWGRADRQVEIAFEYLTPSLTYSGVGNLFSTYGAIDDVSYGSSYWMQGTSAPAIFNTSHGLKTLNGANVSASLTTGDIGDELVETMLSRVTPRYFAAPTSATMTNYYRQSLADALTQDQTVNQSSARFDVMREAKWHRLLLNFSGGVELPGLVVEMEAGGSE